MTLDWSIFPYQKRGLQKYCGGVPLIQILAYINPFHLLMASGCAAVQLDLHS